MRLRLMEAVRLGDDGLVLRYVVEPPVDAAPHDDGAPVTPAEGR